jgi:MFS family permease
VWVLGFVSLLMDISSELIHSLLPVFMVSALGASVLMVGVVEGIAKSTALIVKVFSGALSDYLGKRKALAVAGYGLGAISKPVFALALTINWVLAARFMDRIGKGIRDAPRDALVADITPPEIRGAAYGLRQSLDTIGAFIGPLAAIGLMDIYSGNIRSVFWWSVVPAVLCVVLLARGVEEPGDTVAPGRTPPAMPLQMSQMKALGRRYWMSILLIVLFSLARYSEGFLILKAISSGLRPTLAPMVLIAMNIVYALTSAPVGVLSDRIGRSRLMLAGVGMLVIADLILATAHTTPAVFAGVAAFGLHLGLTQGLFSTLIAVTAPQDLRGTAFGVMNLALACALLTANVVAGALWETAGPTTTFLASAAFAALMGLGYLGFKPSPSSGTGP